MTLRIPFVLFMACLLALPATSAAQNTVRSGAPNAGARTAQDTGEITFTVPVNLTQLSSELSKVRVTCGISSEAITVNREVAGKTAQGPATGPGSIAARQEFPVVGGEVKTTATLVVSTAGVLDNPIGKPAVYNCTLDGFSVAQQRFIPFNYTMDFQTTEPAFRLTLPGNSQPVLLRLTGTFTW